MSDYSIMQEHTLVLAGDTVDSGSVWQGWPSNQIIPLEIYRKEVMSLVTKAVFQKNQQQQQNNNSFDRSKQRQNDRLQMMEESKSSSLTSKNLYQSEEMKIPIDSSLSSSQKKVSFKHSPISPLSSSGGGSIHSYSSISTSPASLINQKTPPSSTSKITSKSTSTTPSPGNNGTNGKNKEDKETTPLLSK